MWLILSNSFRSRYIKVWNQICRRFIVCYNQPIWCRSSSKRGKRVPSVVFMAWLWSWRREYCIRGDWLCEESKLTHFDLPRTLFCVDSRGNLEIYSNSYSTRWKIGQSSRCSSRDWSSHWLCLYSFSNPVTTKQCSWNRHRGFLRTLPISNLRVCGRTVSSATCTKMFSLSIDLVLLLIHRILSPNRFGRL